MEDALNQDEKLCSNCKRMISANAFVLHEAHCRRRLKLCEVCEEPVPLEEMEQHHLENHAPVSCEHCGASMPADSLEDHLESQCPERELNCKYCELEVRAGDYDSHVDACGSRTDFCDRCNMRVMLKDMEEHKITKCGDLKATEELRPEPTLENLPPSYMDGFEGTGFSTAPQGIPIGNQGSLGAVGQIFGGSGGFGIPLMGGRGFVFFAGRPPAQAGGQSQGREENFQLDREWLQEVGGVCEGEDLDRMMAEAIAMEQASSRQQFGADENNLSEGEFLTGASHEEEDRPVDDEEMARRLQHTFDHELDMERADESLARRLGKEEEENAGPPHEAPQLTSVYPVGTVPPINAHQPRSPLTSLLPGSDYQTSISRSRFSDLAVAGVREADDNDEDAEERENERERERARKREREKVREREREKIREREREREEREWERAREREREREKVREREREREREKVREREREREEREWERAREMDREWEREERQREDDMLIAEQLQVEESERLKSEVEQEMKRSKKNNSDASAAAPVRTSPQDGDHKVSVDDEEIAFKLQTEEIEEAKTRIEARKREMRDTKVLLEFKRQEMNLSERKIAENNAEIRRLRRKIAGLSREKERELWERSSASGGASHWGREPTTGQGEEFDESYFEPRPHEAKPSVVPLPVQDPRPVPEFSDLSGVEPYGDEEPRPKPKPHPGTEGADESIPCQFCHESFPMDVIMSHQQYCESRFRNPQLGQAGNRGGGARGGARGRGRRPVPKGIEVNLKEVLRGEPSPTRPTPSVGEADALCRHCNEAYPQAIIDPHQALCEKNPDKGLKHAYKSRQMAAVQSSTSHSFSPNPPRAPQAPQTLSQFTPSHPAPTTTTGEEDVGLPCEYCQMNFPLKKLLSHMVTCPKRPKPQHKAKPHPMGGANNLTTTHLDRYSPSEVAPCQFCNKQIPLVNLIKHEAVCRFQRLPSPPSSPASSPSSSSQPHSPSAGPSTATFSHHSNSSSHQRNTAATLPSQTPVAATGPTRSTVPSLALTDDQKVGLGQSHEAHTHSSAPQPTHTTSSRVATSVSKLSSTGGKTVTTHTTASVYSTAQPVPTHTVPHSSVGREAVLGSTAQPVPTHTVPHSSVGREAVLGKGSSAIGGGISGVQGTRVPQTLPQTLPQIFMYKNASQPHSVRASSSSLPGKGSTSLGARESASVSVSDAKAAEKSVKRQTPQNDNGYNRVAVTAGHAVSTNSGRVTQAGSTVPARSAHSTTTVQPQTSLAHSVSSGQPPSPLPSFTTSLTSQGFSNSQTSRPFTGGPNNTPVYRRPHESVPPTGESSRYISTDSTTVRPTQSDFEALQRHHSALVPTPIPMTTSLVANPLKTVTMTTNTSGLSLVGDLSVIPPISAGPISKKGLVKSTGDKTYYNTTQSSSLSANQGSMKMMMGGSLIQRAQLGDLEVVPNSLQNSPNTSLPSHNTAPLTRNTVTSPDKANSDELRSGNQKLSMMTTFPGLHVVPMFQQQNLRNTLPNADKPGHITHPGLLGMADLSTEGRFFPMQQTFNSRNSMSLNDSSTSLKEMSLGKSPLKTTKLKLGKLLKEKDKGKLDLIKITGAPAPTTNISLGLAGSTSSLGVISQAPSEDTTPSPSPLTQPSQLPHGVSPSLSTSAANPPPFPAFVYSSSQVSPAPSTSSTENNPPQFPSTATPSPTSPADMKLPGSSQVAHTTVESKPSLTPGERSVSQEDSEGADSGSSEELLPVASVGPLVEYTGSDTYMDHNQHMTGHSAGKTEEEEEQESEDEDTEMPELEEMPSQSNHSSKSSSAAKGVAMVRHPPPSELSGRSGVVRGSAVKGFTAQTASQWQRNT